MIVRGLDAVDQIETGSHGIDTIAEREAGCVANPEIDQFSTFDPSISSNLGAQISQPLLRGFGDVNRTGILVAINNYEGSLEAFRGSVQQTLFSTINALTLSPALSGLVLKLPSEKKNLFFRGFDKFFQKTGNGYTTVAKTLVRRSAIALLLALGLIGLTGWQFAQLPTGFLPVEDQGYMLVSVQLPDSASQAVRSPVILIVNSRPSASVGDDFGPVPCRSPPGVALKGTA